MSLLPCVLVESLHFFANVAADACPACEQLKIACDSRSHYAAVAAEHFQQPRVKIAAAEFLDGLDEIASAVGCDHFAGDEILFDIGGLQKSAADGENGAKACLRAVKFAGRNIVCLNAVWRRTFREVR